MPNDAIWVSQEVKTEYYDNPDVWLGRHELSNERVPIGFFTGVGGGRDINAPMEIEYVNIEGMLFRQENATDHIFPYQYLYLAFASMLENKDFDNIWTYCDRVTYQLTPINPSNYPLQTNYLVDASTWVGPTHPITSLEFDATQHHYLLEPVVKLIGDELGDTVSVPRGNTTIKEYILGDPTDRTHLNPKPLLYNAPTEYNNNGEVISRTWFTFNAYTAEQWANGYHFLGNE